jgi:hypothetical protein
MDGMVFIPQIRLGENLFFIKSSVLGKIYDTK